MSKESIDNIYKLDGKVPVGKAIPFGLQHVLAMFVANIAPILIVAGVVKMPKLTLKTKATHSLAKKHMTQTAK